ncbi:MAG: PAS domain-containing sensor histidine kinase [Candidatus Odinarchaeota archaeon]
MSKEQHYQAILDALPDVIFQLDKDGTFLSHSGEKNGSFMLPDDVLGKKIVDIFPPDVARSLMDNLNTALQTPETPSFEFQLQVKEETRYYESRMVIYGKSEILMIIRDITTLKLIEEELREKDITLSLIEEIAHIGIWEWNVVDDVVTFSEEMYWIFDVEEQEFQMRNLPSVLERLVHPDEIQKVNESVTRSLESGTINSIEFRTLRSDGEIRWIRADGIFVYDQQGNRIKLIGFVQDVTQRKQTEEILEKQRAELSDFAHFIAHDLRNSLTTIEGYAVLLERKNLPYLDIILKQTRAMRKLLERSLELADAGLAIEKTDNVDLNSLITDVAKVTIPSGIKFSLDRLPIVPGDKEKLYQAFKNIIENAVRHGSPSKIEIKLNKSKKGTSIFIENDGKQIPPEIIDKVFIRGFSTMKDSKGLGLTIVKKQVEAHGWEINLQSTPKTTVFEIILPVEK